MVFGWLFGKNKELDQHKKEVSNHIRSLKDELGKAAHWINHLHSKGENHDVSIGEMRERMDSLENDVGEIKTFISFFNTHAIKQVSKQYQTPMDKQPAVVGVQTPIQTSIQSAFLRSLTASERLVVWILLNTDMKLSCEDVSVLLNKDRSTVRGQLNNIKNKSDGLIKEVVENSGKKRFFIDEKVREMLLRNMGSVKRIKKLQKVKSED